MMVPLLLTGCEGTFDWIYDQAEPVAPVEGELHIDASEWKKWYYIDLQAVTDSVRRDSTYDGSTAFVAYDIPFEATGAAVTETGHQQPGQYMYWYDVFGEGLKNNRFEYFTPTAAQQEPALWTIALHRNNARTNPAVVAGVCETQLTDVEAVTSEMLSLMTFEPDVWTENEVWDDQSQMLLCYVPSQGIRLNRVLSSWLEMYIPPTPPAFTHNNHVFVLSLLDGSYMALQLADYMDAKGKKCVLTIKYRSLVGK